MPADKKDAKYWERRKKNNDAAKRSRDLRRKKMDDELKVAKEAMQENQKLKQEIDVSWSIQYHRPYTTDVVTALGIINYCSVITGEWRY